MLRRLVRLCIVLWPAFGLAALCTGGVTRRWARPHAASCLPRRAQRSRLPVLLCNAAFLQTAACPQFAANGALWSLFNEFWYYMLFPPLALALLPGCLRRAGSCWAWRHWACWPG